MQRQKYIRFVKVAPQASSSGTTLEVKQESSQQSVESPDVVPVPHSKKRMWREKKASSSAPESTEELKQNESVVVDGEQVPSETPRTKKPRRNRRKGGKKEQQTSESVVEGTTQVDGMEVSDEKAVNDEVQTKPEKPARAPKRRANKKFKKTEVVLQPLDEEHAVKINHLVETINGDAESNLIIFINTFLKYYSIPAGKDMVVCELDLIEEKLGQWHPNLLSLFNAEFITKHSNELFQAQLINEGKSIKSKSIRPLFTHKQGKFNQEYYDRLVFKMTLNYVRKINLYTGSGCRSLCSFASFTNFFKKPKAQMAKYLYELITEGYKDYFFIEEGANDLRDAVVWDIEAYNVIENIPVEIVPKQLVCHFRELDVHDHKQIIVSHVRDLDDRIWTAFNKHNTEVPYVIDTEWTFSDPIEMGPKLIQISSSTVALLLLVDFDERPSDELVHFLSNPSILKIAFTLCGDCLKINNWFKKFDIPELEREFHHDNYTTSNGWVEGDPFSLGLSKLLPFMGGQDPRIFESTDFHFTEHRWNYYDMLPWKDYGLKRIEYAALDVLVGYHYFLSVTNPCENLFNIKLGVDLKMERSRCDEVRKALKKSIKENPYHFGKTIKHNIPLAFHKGVIYSQNQN